MPDHSPSTDERASLTQPSQSSSPLECTSHLGFSLVPVGQDNARLRVQFPHPLLRSTCLVSPMAVGTSGLLEDQGGIFLGRPHLPMVWGAPPQRFRRRHCRPALGQQQDSIPPLPLPGSRCQNHLPTQILDPLCHCSTNRVLGASDCVAVLHSRLSDPRQIPPPMASGILYHFLHAAAVMSQFSLLVVSVDLPLGSLDFDGWIAEMEFGEREFIWRWFIRPVVLSH